ncbi:MAG: ABC transporter permease [Acetobacteraceae bacterium]|nr:ABC transporter permease [Acetobacteraceae bacterium]
MLMFLARRALIALLVTLTVLTISFALTRLSGDLAVAIAGPQATAADVDVIRRAYGLDRPLTVQFFAWVTSALRGDLGQSYMYHDSVSRLIAARLPVTLTLGLTGLLIAIATAIPLGIIAAMREGSMMDRGIMTIAVVGQAMPSFWLGLTLIIFFGLKLGWLPISGVETWEGYVLPGIVLSFSAIPALMRLTRSGMVDALASDYIRTARAKGLSRTAIVLKHALRNAAMPVVAISAVQLGFMLSGSVVIETVFSLQGVGYLGWEAISKNDFPVVQSVVLFLAVVFVLLTLLADMMNAALDPRLRTQ